MLKYAIIIAMRALGKCWEELHGRLENLQASPQALYLVLALVFGFIFVVITPAFFNADEPNHLFRVYQLSTGRLLAAEIGHGKIGGYLPAGLPEAVDEDRAQAVLGSSAQKDVEILSRNLRHIPLQKHRLVPVVFPNTALYSPLVYVPQLLAVLPLRLLDAPAVYMLYAGRLLGLVASVLLFYAAIRYIPFGKWALVAIGLLPMSISCFSTFSGDGVTIGVCTLLVAYTLHIVYDDNMGPSRRRYALLAALAVCVALAKFTYLPLVLLVLLIPIINPKARSRRLWLALGCIIIVGMLVSALWQHEVAYVKNIYPDPLRAHVNAVVQTKNVMRNPVDYISKQFANTIFTNNSDGIVWTMFGDFASLAAPLPLLFVLLSAATVALAYGSATKQEIVIARQRTLTSLMRWGILGVALLTTLLVVTALYLYWTPVGSLAAQGVQGRYFIPILCLGVLIVPRKILIDPRTRARLIANMSCLVLLVSVVVCLAKFYSVQLV